MSKKRLTVLLITLISIFLLILYSDFVKQGAIKGLILSANVLIPSIFPIFVLSVFLTNSGLLFSVSKYLHKPAMRIFKMNGFELCIFLMSLISSYPVSAAIITESVENKNISSSRAKKLMHFCVNGGPSFIIIAVGNSVFNSKAIGVILFSALSTASIILAFLVCNFTKEKPQKPQRIISSSLSDSFVNATTKSAYSVLGISAWVVLFSSIIETVKNVFSLNKISEYAIFSLEITNSVFSIKNIYVICFLLAFSGFCIHLQIYSILKISKPKYVFFLLFRIVHGLLSCIILKILLKIFPQSIYTIVQSNYNYKTSYVSILSSFALILMTVCLLLNAKKGGNKEENMLK